MEAVSQVQAYLKVLEVGFLLGFPEARMYCVLDTGLGLALGLGGKRGGGGGTAGGSW